MLDDILLHCQNTSTLEAAYALLKTLSSNAKFSGALESGSSMLDEILEDMGFGGLWRSCSTRHGDGLDKQSVYLTEKLIEVCFFLWIARASARQIHLALYFPHVNGDYALQSARFFVARGLSAVRGRASK